MSVLCDSWGGGLTGADSPDGLVSDDNRAPVGDGGLDSIKLLLEDVICLIGLSLLESLTNAKDDLKVGGLGAGDLLGDSLVSLTEQLSTLGVTNKGPLKTKVDNLVGTDLASEGAISISGGVLGGDELIRVQHRLCGCNVKRNRGDNDLNAVLIKFHSVEGIGAHGANEVDRAIALPVASNDVLSLGGCLDHSD